MQCFLQVKIPQFCKDFSLSTGGEIFTCKKQPAHNKNKPALVL